MKTTILNNGCTRNARFWTFENDGWVKLTLRPDQSLSWGKATRHDEGYSAEGNTWIHEGSHVALQWSREGRDCDGRVSSAGELECALTDLAAICGDSDNPAHPDWREASPVRCRDEFAEAAPSKIFHVRKPKAAPASKRQNKMQAIKARHKIGATVTLTDAALENYGEAYRGKPLRVAHVATRYMTAREFYASGKPAGFHPGFDDSTGCALYDLDGLNFSLYEWEVR